MFNVCQLLIKNKLTVNQAHHIMLTLDVYYCLQTEGERNAGVKY